jgi:preprotein translocase subunit SecA
MANFFRTLIENDKKEIKRLDQMANKIEALADQMSALSDEELRAKTDEFRQRYQQGETLDQLLTEACLRTISISCTINGRDCLTRREHS